MNTAKNLNQFFNISIRNERYSLAEFSLCEVYVDSHKVEIKDLSESGFSVLSKTQLDAGLEHVFSIKFNKSELATLKCRIVRGSKEGNSYLYGFRFVDEMLPENFVQNIILSFEVSKEVESERETSEVLNPEFLITCAKLQNYLMILKDKCEAFEKVNYIQSLEAKNASLQIALKVFGEPAIEQIKKYAHTLDAALKNIENKNTRKVYGDYFRKHLGDYFVDASFTGRAFFKPRGYAGDYEMMNQIYRNVAEGQTLFEKIIHLYGINEASSVSVRLRKEYLKRKLKNLLKQSVSTGQKMTVGTLACGPAREILEFLSEENPEHLKNFTFVLMDQDHHALLNSRRNILKVVTQRELTCEVYFLPLSVKQILDDSEESEVLKAVNFDLLYTAGLYDYLTQPVAKNLTTKISKSVVTGGELIIGNFHPDNPTKTISDLVADWRLIHRNKEQMADLISAADFKKSEFYLDEIGIDLFIEAYK